MVLLRYRCCFVPVHSLQEHATRCTATLLLLLYHTHTNTATHTLTHPHTLFLLCCMTPFQQVGQQQRHRQRRPSLRPEVKHINHRSRSRVLTRRPEETSKMRQRVTASVVLTGARRVKKKAKQKSEQEQKQIGACVCPCHVLHAVCQSGFESAAFNVFLFRPVGQLPNSLKHFPWGRRNNCTFPTLHVL